MLNKFKTTILFLLKIFFYLFLLFSLLMFIGYLVGESKITSVLWMMVFSSIFWAPYIILKYFSEGKESGGENKDNNNSSNSVNCPSCWARLKKNLPKKWYIKCDYCDNYFR